MSARVLAIIAAVVLIGGAVLVRSAITDDGSDKGCDSGDELSTAVAEGKAVEDCRVASGGGSDRPRVACTPDLDAVCNDAPISSATVSTRKSSPSSSGRARSIKSDPTRSPCATMRQPLPAWASIRSR